MKFKVQLCYTSYITICVAQSDYTMPQEPQKWQGTAKGSLPITNEELRYSLIR